MSWDDGPLRHGSRGLFPHPPQHGRLRHGRPRQHPTHHGRVETVRGTLHQRSAKLRGRGGGITVARVFVTSALFVWMAVVVCQPGPSLVTRSAHWNFSKKKCRIPFFDYTINDDLCYRRISNDNLLKANLWTNNESPHTFALWKECPHKSSLVTKPTLQVVKFAIFFFFRNYYKRVIRKKFIHRKY